MILFDSTYPPSPSTMVPPPTRTASTGAPADIGWMVPASLALILLASLVLRIASRRARLFTHGTV